MPSKTDRILGSQERAKTSLSLSLVSNYMEYSQSSHFKSLNKKGFGFLQTRKKFRGAVSGVSRNHFFLSICRNACLTELPRPGSAVDYPITILSLSLYRHCYLVGFNQHDVLSVLEDSFRLVLNTKLGLMLKSSLLTCNIQLPVSVKAPQS